MDGARGAVGRCFLVRRYSIPKSRCNARNPVVPALEVAVDRQLPTTANDTLERIDSYSNGEIIASQEPPFGLD